MKYFIETYGCQMNKAESSALETQLAERSWQAAGDPSEADLVLINTCSVRITAETRAWGRIEHYAAQKKTRKFNLVVTGCMAERLKDRMKAKAPGIDHILGNFQKSAFGTMLSAIESGMTLDAIEESPVFVFAPSHHEPGAYSSFVPIMHGCDNFCSYCIVPYVRGREVSRDPEAVKAEISAAARAGVREITLIGQNVNSYHWKGGDGDLDFAALLRKVALWGKADGIGRIRFVSSHPKDLSDATIEAIAGDDIFARHIHLCAQHGSDRVLKAMNRVYTSDDYLNLVDKIRRRIPGVSISSDILMGFPGETEEDVEATLALMRSARFAYAFMYHFNPREGTPAARMADQVPVALRKERLARVIELQKRITRDVMHSMIGSESLALIESVSSRTKDEVLARTDQDMMVVFPSSASRIGTFAKLRLMGIRGNTFRALEVPC
jgi:tRNA-2-methylthio-N6-dimethylallyladenosine synthase